MSVGPLGGVLGSAAGAPLAQTKGSETERAKGDSASQARQLDADKKTEQSSGVGQTQEDQGASDRDADGRRLWEAPAEEATAGNDTHAPTNDQPRSKDATGAAGSKLDLMG